MSVGATTPAPSGSRKLVFNFLLLTAGEFTAKLLTFAAFFYLARVLGAERYGSLEFTLAVMMFFTLPADMGLGTYGARELAKGGRDPRTLFREIVEMRMLLAVASFLCLILFIAVLPKAIEVKLLLGAYGLSLIGNPLLLQWFFQGHDQMHWVALASIVRQGVFAGLVFTLLRPDSPLLLLGLFECTAVFAACALCVVTARAKHGVAIGFPNLKISRLYPHLREGLPIGATELAWAFVWYFATVLLGLLFSDDSLGWFGASHRMLMALHTFVWLYFFNLLPSISRCVAQPRSKLLELMRRSMDVTAWSGIFVALVMTLLAREALTVAYGDEFAGGAAPFALLMWMLPIAMLSGHHRYALIAFGHQQCLLRCTIYSAVIAVALGCALVPALGATGAALALLSANFANFILVYRATARRIVEVPVHPHIGWPLIALAVAAGVHALLDHMNPWASASLAAATYVLMLVLSQRRQILSLVRLIARGGPRTAARASFAQ